MCVCVCVCVCVCARVCVCVCVCVYVCVCMSVADMDLLILIKQLLLHLTMFISSKGITSNGLSSSNCLAFSIADLCFPVAPPGATGKLAKSYCNMCNISFLISSSA